MTASGRLEESRSQCELHDEQGRQRGRKREPKKGREREAEGASKGDTITIGHRDETKLAKCE